jgi:YggT family protein
MVIQLLLLILKAVSVFFTSILLFRFYCFLIKLNLKWIGGNLGHFVLKITDWIVLPLRRLIPSFGVIDISTLICAYSVQCIYGLILVWLTSGYFHLQVILMSAFFDLLLTCISGFTALIFFVTLLTWFSVNDQIKNLFEVLVDPILRPFRNFIPFIAGVDISPFIALLFLQVLNILLQGIRIQIIN